MLTAAHWSIRHATDADRAVRREIIHAAWLAAYAHIFTLDEINALFHGQVQQTSSREHRHCERLPGVVVVRNDGVVGTAGLARWRDGAGELVRLYLRPAEQGQGIGRALWEARVAIVRAHGCPSLNVWVLERAPAVHFYEHCGGIQYRWSPGPTASATITNQPAGTAFLCRLRRPVSSPRLKPR